MRGKSTRAQTLTSCIPLKVMLRVTTLEERIVAVLHDVVEDCGISLDDLRKEGFSEVVLTAIESVTKVPGESYEAFVERAAQNPIGRVVKLADLEENSDLSRIAQPSWEDLGSALKNIDGRSACCVPDEQIRPHFQCELRLESPRHHCAIKSRIARMVCVGASSINQCPAPGMTTSVTLSAALRITIASLAPKDFSPPTASTGMVSRVAIDASLSTAS